MIDLHIFLYCNTFYLVSNFFNGTDVAKLWLAEHRLFLNDKTLTFVVALIKPFWTYIRNDKNL